MKIDTNAPKTDRSLAVEYDFGSNLQDAVSKFGEEVVFSNYKQSVVISLQGLVRRNLELKDDKRLDDATILSKVVAWVPGVATIRSAESVQDKALKAFETMTPEAKAAFIKRIKESMAG